jgi:DNA polymerase III subunit epsilon
VSIYIAETKKMIFDYLERQLQNEDLDFKTRDRYFAIKWAREILSKKNKIVYLDTETTGLGSKDEIIELSIVNYQGRIIFGSLIKPTCPVSDGAKATHKITDSELAKAPTLPEIYPQIEKILEGKTVIIYNAKFDSEKIEYQCKLHDLPNFLPSYYEDSDFCLDWILDIDCAMEQYAKYHGVRHHYYNSYTWQKLPGASHRASGDAIACYNLVTKMANTYVPKPTEKYPQFPSTQIFIKWEKAYSLSLTSEINDNKIFNFLIKLPRLIIKKDDVDRSFNWRNFKKLFLEINEDTSSGVSSDARDVRSDISDIFMSSDKENEKIDFPEIPF